MTLRIVFCAMRIAGSSSFETLPALNTASPAIAFTRSDKNIFDWVAMAPKTVPMEKVPACKMKNKIGAKSSPIASLTSFQKPLRL